MANSRIKTALIGVCATWILGTCAHVDPVNIIVAPDVQGDEEVVRLSTHEAIDFYCEVRNIDDCDEWTNGMFIFISANPEIREDGWTLYGLFTAPSSIWFAWLDGLHENALFHELLHYELYHAGKGYWAEHSEWFLDTEVLIQEMWVER